MAIGGGLGSLLPAAMALGGIVAILRGRKSRKAGQTSDRKAADDAFEIRRAATRESERRMAAYLAQRDSGHGDSRAEDWTEQENRR